MQSPSSSPPSTLCHPSLETPCVSKFSARLSQQSPGWPISHARTVREQAKVTDVNCGLLVRAQGRTVANLLTPSLTKG